MFRYGTTDEQRRTTGGRDGLTIVEVVVALAILAFSIGGMVKYFQENLDQYQVKAVLADLGGAFGHTACPKRIELLRGDRVVAIGVEFAQRLVWGESTDSGQTWAESEQGYFLVDRDKETVSP